MIVCATLLIKITEWIRRFHGHRVGPFEFSKFARHSKLHCIYNYRFTITGYLPLSSTYSTRVTQRAVVISWISSRIMCRLSIINNHYTFQTSSVFTSNPSPMEPVFQQVLQWVYIYWHNITINKIKSIPSLFMWSSVEFNVANTKT